jgi:hypothetical protein
MLSRERFIVMRSTLPWLALVVSCGGSATPAVKIATPVSSAVPPLVVEARALVVAHAMKGAAYALGQRVLVIDGKTLSIFDRHDAAPIATRTLDGVFLFGTQPGDTPVQGNVLVGQTHDGSIVALDAATLRDVWSLPRTGKREWVIGTAHATGTIALQWSLSGGNEYEVVALDDATGAVRWTRSGQVLGVWGSGSNVYISDGAFTAIDAKSGKEIFRREHLGAHHVAANDTRVVTTWGDETVRVLDAHTGVEISAAKVGVVTWGSELVLDGPTAYAYAGDALIAIDLASGALRWRHEMPNLLPAHGGTSTGGVATTPSSLLFCTSDGVVHAVDRRSGSEQWSYGVGHCNPIVASEHGAAAYIQSDSGSDLLTPGERHVRTVTLSGVVKHDDDPVPNATVAAFGSKTTADAQGRYTLSISGEGAVVVSARGDVAATENCDSDASGSANSVTLDGRAAYTIDVDVTQQCWCGL